MTADCKTLGTSPKISPCAFICINNRFWYSEHSFVWSQTQQAVTVVHTRTQSGSTTNYVTVFGAKMLHSSTRLPKEDFGSEVWPLRVPKAVVYINKSAWGNFRGRCLGFCNWFSVHRGGYPKAEIEEKEEKRERFLTNFVVHFLSFPSS